MLLGDSGPVQTTFEICVQRIAFFWLFLQQFSVTAKTGKYNEIYHVELVVIMTGSPN